MTDVRNASIFHHPDAIESDKTPLAGRRTAGQSFLRGFARHAEAEVLHCAAGADAHIEHFREIMAGNGWTRTIEGALTHEPERLRSPGCLFLPGPSLGAHAWPRRRVGQRAFSLCGITHTVATQRMMEAIHDCLTGPVEAWDAIICTSQAVQRVVAAEMDETEAYLSRRFGARRVPRPQLPVIPLGIDASTFARSDVHRDHWRRRYDIAEDGIVVMTMGRLNAFEKLHPLPLALALERAAQETGRQITLLMVGWFSDGGNESVHRDIARYAPSIRVEFPDGRDPELRFQIWSAADIFALPVDNIQETFGLAPVEAMAAGLPVVCSDWDGFKDTIIDGETGIRVRTLMAPAGMGQAIAERFEDGQDGYLQYLGVVQHRTVVDVSEMADAFCALIRDPDLRARMGAAGIERVRQVYDWSQVVPRYQDLWADLAARRAAGVATSERAAGRPANPRAMDPFLLYACYPSDVLDDGAMLEVGHGHPRHAVDAMVEASGAPKLRRLPASARHLQGVMNAVAERAPLRLQDLLAAHPQADPNVIRSAVLWLAKFDMIRIRS